MAIKTQGTKLFMLDPDDCNTIIAVDCVVSMSGLNAPRDQIESTCLEDAAKTFLPGNATPGQLSATIYFDPSSESHGRIVELWQAGTKMEMAIGESDGDKDSNGDMEEPTADSNCLFDLPDTRSWLVLHDAYIADVSHDFPLNGIRSATVAIQQSGFYDFIPKSAT